MPPVNRHEPIRADCSESSFSLMEFMREFPDDASCLEHLSRQRYSPDGEHAECPKCGQERVFQVRHRAGRQSWTCAGCGLHVHPTAGTIFAKSSTSLHLWYYATYLMASTRCRISAKQLERQIGVSYRTAWRMLNLIRNELMRQDGEPLTGEVEIDETSLDGKPRRGYLPQGTETERRSAAMNCANVVGATVFAAVERGGRIKATLAPGRRRPHIKQQVIEWVVPDAVYTDEWPVYNGGVHFVSHSRVRHAYGEYVIGMAHTNTVEGFFWNLKTSIRGTYKKVSHHWLQGYLNEFCWRYGERNNTTRSMFDSLLDRATA